MDPNAPECEYLRCRPDGDLINSGQCKTSIKFTKLALEAQNRRKTCDVSLGSDIVASNVGKAVCRAFGYVYAKAVRNFGDPNFVGLDAVPATLKQSREEYEAAIREFFQKGSAAEFEKFNAIPPSMDSSLKYVEGRGLINIP